MTEQEWADVPHAPDVPPKRRGLPGWLWFCGGGCLVALVLVLVGGYFVFEFFREASDPEIQWPKFEKFVEVGERPEGWRIFGLPFVDGFALEDPSSGTAITLWVFKESQKNDFEEVFSGGFEGGGLPVISEVENTELTEVVVQGRKMRMVRFTQTNLVDELDGARGAFLDITPDGGSRPQLMQIITREKDAPISEELLAELLRPFHLGPER